MEQAIKQAIADSGGVLQLDAALVARDWLPPGRRLGLPVDSYPVGDRGFICERWLGSTTRADNRVGPADEGISYVRALDGTRINLRDAVEQAPAALMGQDYASSHDGLGRLAKIYDFAARIPFHVHPPEAQAKLVGRRSKDESSYFPAGVDMGPHPETFFGLHPSIARARDFSVLRRHLEAWKDDAILQHTVAYQQTAETGFYLDSGILHGPGTALTIELQEDSDTLAMFQALNAGTVISKELLYKDVSPQARCDCAEGALEAWIDWEANGDPFFYERRCLVPVPIFTSGDVEESWILHGTLKYCGKRLRLAPGAQTVAQEHGFYNLLAWRGEGTVGGQPVRGGAVGQDELFVVHDTATRPHDIVNTGSEDLVIIKFFGPDIYTDSPAIDRS